MKITDTYLVHPNEVKAFETGCKELDIKFERLEDVFPYHKYELTGDRISSFISLGVNMTVAKLEAKL